METAGSVGIGAVSFGLSELVALLVIGLIVGFGLVKLLKLLWAAFS